MKKIYTKIVAASVAIMLVMLLCDVFSDSDSHRHLAKEPMSLEKILGVQLPQYTVVESSDNLERTTSRFDCFSHHYQFNEPFTPAMIKELNDLCEAEPQRWSKGAEGIAYSYERGDWDSYYIECSINASTAHIDYYVDELDGVTALFEWVLYIFVWIASLILIGVVLLVVWVVKKVIKNR